MNKENADRNGEFSAEQSARISQKFRAAKALLARKRPRETQNKFIQTPENSCPKSGDVRRMRSSASVNVIDRLPLSEISFNTPFPCAKKEFKLVKNETNKSSCFKGTPYNEVDKNSTTWPTGLTIDRENVSNPFETPIRLPECSGGSFSEKSLFSGIESSSDLSKNSTHFPMEDGFGLNSFTTAVRQLDECDLSEPSVSSSLLAEDFDESFFEKIDALCEQKSVTKSAAEESNNGFYKEELEPSRRSAERNSNPVSVGKSLETGDKLDFSDNYECRAMVRTSEDAKVGSLLNDYETGDKFSGEELNKSFHKEELQPSPRSSERNSNLVSIGDRLEAGDKLDFSDNYECGAELRTSEDAQVGSMPKDFEKYMQSLNERQREAACSDISIPLMIVAGPGSGKTSTMVGRILMLLNEGIDPSHILAMTFTTAAASEMRERIGAVAGKAVAKEITVSTFHSFSLQLCRLHAEKLCRTPEFLVYGHGQQRRAIIEAVRLSENENGKKSDLCRINDESCGINVPQQVKDKSKKWLKFVARAKASGKTPVDCHKSGDEIGAAILWNYDDILKACNALDYHDMISCSVKLLTQFPEVFKECQESWKAIVIDEFQDTSAMQYGLLRILASHKCITIVGDEDQSIFSFNGADISGFDSFRKDFPLHKEIRLVRNYRSTRYIVEAASSLISNNLKRCQTKNVLTDNSCGSKITIKECANEGAQCAFVVDKILEIASDSSLAKCSFGNIAVLYRRQVSGKMFQTAFRERKIPFNVHGVAFYRKKVVRAIISMLKTTLPGCDDGPFRRVFKALLPFDKEEKKRIIEHIDKVSTVRKCSYISAAYEIFNAKISGTFKRYQLTQGRKVLATLEMIARLVCREQSVSAVMTSVANMIPQKYLLEQRAVLDVDGGKLLNEDNDLRSVLQYLLDDVSDYLKSQHTAQEQKSDTMAEEKGCINILEAFLDYISERERENFRSRRCDNKESVTLTTIHQSKGLEWDTVFIVKANESEIPLLHEFNGVPWENSSTVEEERRLLYVAMTRARKKLFILYVLMDSNWQVLQPSRFLKEIPNHLKEVQGDLSFNCWSANHQELQEFCRTDMNNNERSLHIPVDLKTETGSKTDVVPNDPLNILLHQAPRESVEQIEAYNGSDFIRRFNTEDRSIISHLFHQWAKKPAFQDPKRLLDKVAFVIDERLRVKKSNHKVVLRELKSCLKTDDAFCYAKHVLEWEKIPADKRAYLMREKQEHFQKLRIESAMGSSAPTSKQIAYLQNLGCTVVPTSRLHASRLIEQYKSL